MSPPLGRPKIDNPKDQQYKIRLTHAEKEKLETCARVTGKTKAAILLEGLELVYQSVTKKKEEMSGYSGLPG